jgi:hypothetical protein
MGISDKIRVAISPLYVVAGISIVVRAWNEPLGWLLGLSFAGFGIYRLMLIKRAL